MNRRGALNTILNRAILSPLSRFPIGAEAGGTPLATKNLPGCPAMREKATQHVAVHSFAAVLNGGYWLAEVRKLSAKSYPLVPVLYCSLI